MHILAKIVKRLKELFDLWPEPNFDKEIEPHFLFIITPPYSGSTAIAKFLNTSKRTTILQKRAEGQWLIPGMCQDDRWKSDKAINYDSVKSVWLHKFQKIRKSGKNIDVVIEKSPPNMMRIIELSSQFKSFSLIANNRNPYANCASILYRHHDANNIGEDNRIEALTSIASSWIKRSLVISELVSEYKIPLITYEDFCKDPSTLVSKLNLPHGVTDTIDMNAVVKVKDYIPQRILNQNDRQISKLTIKEIDHLTSIFVENKLLLKEFGYSLLQS
ncbi:MAG: hypothetical protein OFPI_40710 [Osedax symbiont Rs2]|nr:MAG: hypothetical protein OFPI_40710 [Osedax symbiont Rs2]